MASTYTPNINLEKPTPGEQEGEWGTTLNTNFDTIDTKLAIKDEDDMSSDSASHLSTQQSIKAYVDSKVNTEETIEDFVGGMVTGNTETGIAVTYEDSDGTLDFVVADTTVAGDSGSTGMTPGDTLTIAGGTNVTTAMSGDTLTVTSTDTNTQLTQEQVEDYVGGMLDGDETFITVAYDDTDGNIDFTVPVKDEDNMASDSASYLATQQSIKAYVDDNTGATALDDIAAGDAASILATSTGNITIDAQGDDTDIILKGTDGGADTTFVTIDGSDAGTAIFNNDVVLDSDAAVIKLGADQDVTITHVADTGVLLNSMGVDGVTSINAGQIGGSRNFIYNGDFQIFQRAASASSLGNGSSGYHVHDRWQFYESGAPNAVVTWAGVTETPDGFNSSMRLDVTTASGTVAIADVVYIAQIFEGYDLQSWNKGDAQAKAVTLSFWVNTTKTGTYICKLYDGDNNRHICKAYTVSSTNTWEYKTLTFAGDTTGAFTNDANTSLYVIWALVAGTNFTSGTLDTSWASFTAANSYVGQVDALDSTSNYFHMTGVQLELGSTATAFQYEKYGENLLRCQRYYNKRAASNAILYASSVTGSGFNYSHWQFPCHMRAAPTMTGEGGGSSGNSQQQINVASGGAYAAAGTYATWGNDSTADAELS